MIWKELSELPDHAPLPLMDNGIHLWFFPGIILNRHANGINSGQPNSWSQSNLLRQLLSVYLQQSPDAMVIETEWMGRPILKNGGLHFSLSHSGADVLIALAHKPIGVDIEQTGRQRDWPALAARYFSTAEQDWLRSQKNLAGAFLRLWVAKEAILKAAGTGLAGGLSKLSLCIGADDILTISPTAPESLRAWKLQVFSPASGCIAALACAAGPVDMYGFCVTIS